MRTEQAYFIGIDIGTQGARVVLADAGGKQLAGAEEPFPLNEASREEQSPDEWWAACLRSLRNLIGEVRNDIDLSALKALAVTSTSGTVIPLDGNQRPLHNALMYSDKRSEEVARECREAALRFHPGGYTGFNSSSGLSKMVWFVRTFPRKAVLLARWVHAADYITGQISGRWDRTDFTNALKSGYDLTGKKWPEYLYQQLPLRRDWLPEVVPSGTPLGRIAPSLARSLGLKEDVLVVAGMTDGCASQVASGAVKVGNWNTTIGTTLVVKGVTRKEVRDPEGRLYSHRHPEGYWMPGGASNTGADWVKEFSDKEDLPTLEAQASRLLPGGQMAYPLRQRGERFPFIAPRAGGFGPGNTELSLPARFLANLEGVAYLERYAFELIEKLSGERVRTVYSAGGGSLSDTWLRIRCNVLNRPVFRMQQAGGAFGAAILAASRTWFSSLTEAAGAMTRPAKELLPEPELAGAYDDYYQEFLKVLREKGYIQEKHA